MSQRLTRALFCLFAFAAGCSELGNPDVSVQHTPPSSWTDGVNRLETQTFTVPPERSNELLHALAPMQPHYVDFFAPHNGVVTLVVVEPQLAFLPRQRAVRLVTTFRLRDGTVLRRQWSAPSLAARYYAGLGLPARPIEAVTALEP
jgi:hypothetical protein